MLRYIVIPIKERVSQNTTFLAYSYVIRYWYCRVSNVNASYFCAEILNMMDFQGSDICKHEFTTRPGIIGVILDGSNNK